MILMMGYITKVFIQIFIRLYNKDIYIKGHITKIYNKDSSHQSNPKGIYTSWGITNNVTFT